MLVNFLLLVVLNPQPAQFSVDVEARQPVALAVNGIPVKKGQMYQTRPIHVAPMRTTATFVDGDEVKTAEYRTWMIGGMTRMIRFEITALPNERTCQR